MDARKCYATADTPRAILALVAPFLAVAAGITILYDKGFDPADYFRLLVSGELSWLRQGVAWLALVFWVVRYFPSAWSALRNGPCLVSGDTQNLYLPNGGKIPFASIQGVRVRRDLFRKVAHFETAKDRIAVPLIFIRASSDPLLRSVPTANGSSA